MNLRGPAVRTLLVLSLTLLFVSPLALAETETDTQWQTTASQSQQYFRFAMVGVPVSGASSYPRGNGSAEVQAQGTFVSVHFDAEGVANGAQLALVLLANGTSHSLANMTTSYGGEVEAEGFVSLGAGTYNLGLRVFDASTFSTPTLVMSSNPATQALVLTQGPQETTTTAVATSGNGAPVQEGETEDGSIRSAIQTRQIPAVVEVGDSGSSAIVNDGNFSVSVGRYQQQGYFVSIYAASVSGSRVLMMNVTSVEARSFFSKPFQVSLDGAAIPQASALSEVLGASQGTSARFVLLSGPSTLKLLVLIPHFSYHVIEIVPALLAAGGVLLLYIPALFFAVAAVSVVFLVVNSRRTRVAV